MAIDLGGIWAPIATPLRASGGIDGRALHEHARGVIAEGCQGVLLFGTTGEAPSFSVLERRRALEEVLEAGLPPGRLMVGTGCCAHADSLELSVHAAARGVAALLVLPPFYFKGVSEEGLLRAFAALVEGCGANDPRVLLYHFPRLSGVPIPVSLAARLVREFPGRVVGVKDSSGDAASARAFLGIEDSFAVFPGTESLLPELRGDAIAGCISAGANVHAGPLSAAWSSFRAGEGDDERRVLRLRAVLDRYPMIAALKAILADRRGATGWLRVRAPLVELPGADRAALLDAYADASRP